MQTLTVHRANLDAIRTGDRITALDGHPLTVPHVVEQPLGRTDVPGIKLVHDSPVDWYLYPDHVWGHVTVERDDRIRAARVGRYAVPLTRQPDGSYRTDDGALEIFYNEGYLTSCDERHGSCPGGRTHEYARWCVWDTLTDDYLHRDPGGYDTLRDAAEAVAALRKGH